MARVDGIAYLLHELAETKAELERCQRRLRRAQVRRRPRRKNKTPEMREWSVEQWRQHAVILARIRSIPDRPTVV